jgi:hypothetical protein
MLISQKLIKTIKKSLERGDIITIASKCNCTPQNVSIKLSVKYNGKDHTILKSSIELALERNRFDREILEESLKQFEKNLPNPISHEDFEYRVDNKNIFCIYKGNQIDFDSVPKIIEQPYFDAMLEDVDFIKRNGNIVTRKVFKKWILEKYS